MKTRMTNLVFGLATIAVLLLTGCDIKLAGENGVIDFHPDDCGMYSLGCNFDKPIVVGGTIEVRLVGNIGTSDPTLRPEDETLLSVIPSESGKPRQFEVEALGEGSTTLMVLDQEGDIVDQIAINTTAFEGLRVRPFLNVPEEPETDIEGAQTFRVPQDKIVAFWVGPDIGDDWMVMGELSFELIDTSDEVLKAMEAEESTNVEAGYIAFRMPAGSHQMVLGTSDGNHMISLMFIAE